MALDPIIGLTYIEQAQSGKEVTANQAFADLAQAAGGVLSKSVSAGGTINLSLDESQYGCILLTGAPGSSVTVVQHPDAPKRTFYQNLTTSGQTIFVKIGATGTPFEAPVNGLLLLLSSTDAIRLGTNTAPLPLRTTASAGTSEELARSDHRHARDIVELAFNTATVTWTNQPAALTEFLGLHDRRALYDLTHFSEARLIANVEVAGATGATLRAEFATTDGGTYAALDNATGPNVPIHAVGTIAGSWVSLHATAKAEVFLRISGVGGDGVADPEIGRLVLQVR